MSNIIEENHDEMYNFLKSQEDVTTHNINIEILMKDKDVLGLTPDIGELDSRTAVVTLLHVLVSHAREVTEIDEFIKSIVSLWGGYDEMEVEQ